MPLDHCSINGKIVPINQAVLPVTNIEFAYGFGAYEHLRVVKGGAQYCDEHLERLFRSARIIGLEHRLSTQQLTQWIDRLTSKIQEPAYNLKILLVGASEPKDARCFFLPMAPLFPKKEWYTHGVSTTVVSFERPFPQAKTLSMLGSYLAYRQAKQCGCYDALAVDSKGFIREGTRTNFFAVKGRTLCKPPSKLILDGVTQRHVLAIAKRNGFKVVDRLVKPDALKSYDGALLTGTSIGVVPIRSVDTFTFQSIADTIKELMRVFGRN
ncbi:aminotransferase class IV [Candidatus Uhrbacteria bacterium]|nr:aminotransferase class IV [Candidatus Uhrbacteria bacterium]